MDDYVRNYLVALPIFILVDFTWIGVIAKNVYISELGTLARVFDGKFKPNLPAALIAWALIPLGIVVFVVPRLTPETPVLEVIGWGAMFGAVTYGIYDFTNLATLKGYTTKLTLIDTAWGTVLSAIVTTIVWLVAK
jgi:uncharacterized membrane protein